MMPAATQIFVESQDSSSLVVLAPPYWWLAGVFLGLGLTALLVGAVMTFALRRRRQAGSAISFGSFLPLFVPLLVGAPFVVTALTFARSTRVTLLPELHQIRVDTLLLSTTLKTQWYPLDQVRGFALGVGEGCRSLRAVMDDGSGATLIDCTDRSGYAASAEAMNRFVAEHQGGSVWEVR